jgi:RNA polymerase sigma-B factor
VNVPRWLREIKPRVSRSSDRLFITLGRTPTIAEIAKDLGETEDHVSQTLSLSSAWRAESLDVPCSVADGDFGSTLDMIGAPCDGIVNFADSEDLRRALDRLKPLERRVIQHYYFDGMNGVQVAARLGCSDMHVSRIRRHAIARLRRFMSAEMIHA